MGRPKNTTSAPLHETIREEIRARIRSGVYEPGVAIPSTTLLSEEFGVSLITVKRALRDLQSTGTLTSIAGKGTFVKEQRRFLRKLDTWMSSIENARELGFRPSLQLISITREKIVEPAMEILNPPTEMMLCVRKTIFADGLPVMYDSTYLTPDLDGAIIDRFGEQFVADALEDHDIHITDNQLVIDAAPASDQSCQIFSVSNGYPMLRRLYRYDTARPEISVFGLVESPFDRLACTISLPVRQRETSA